jgi:PTH1 family peptidyl-tRNA hydrolase
MLIVGLGNPGKSYEKTRHNIGFIAVDALSDKYNFLWSTKSKFSAEIAEGLIQNQKIILAKPTTYMNLSGISVKAISSYYNIPNDDILVIHDDLDVKIGSLKVKTGGGHAGHNGLKSLDAHIGNNYHRIRIGIGRPQDEEVANYVLSNISKVEWEQQKILIDKICDNFDLLLQKNLEEFKSKVPLK